MHDFHHNLLASRRRAGLSQADCAHLLGISPSRMSRLERGVVIPTVRELSGVALLFGRTMEFLSGTLFLARARDLRERLFDLREPRRSWLGRFNRNHTLHQIGERIDRIIEAYDA